MSELESSGSSGSPTFFKSSLFLASTDSAETFLISVVSSRPGTIVSLSGGETSVASTASPSTVPSLITVVKPEGLAIRK